MKKRHDAKINLLTERHKFLSRIQKSGEPLSEYISNLKLLAQKCKWVCPSDACKTSIDAIFQAQFIRGLRDTNIREKLLQKKSDTKLEETLDAGLALEAAHKQNTEAFSTSTSGSNIGVNKISYNNKNSNTYKYRRGRSRSKSNNKFQ